MTQPSATRAATFESAGDVTESVSGDEAVVRVADLHVRLTRRHASLPVLRGVDLEIAPGEILGLVGESGSGKSVLGLSLLGLLPEESRPIVRGSVEVDGTEITTAPAAVLRELRRNRLGAIFQDPMTSLDPTMRIGKQMLEVAHSTAQVVSLLNEVGVPDPATPDQRLSARVVRRAAATGHDRDRDRRRTEADRG